LLKGTQLANLIRPTLQAVAEQAELGIERVRRAPHLPIRFFAALACPSHDTSDQHSEAVNASSN